MKTFKLVAAAVGVTVALTAESGASAKIYTLSVAGTIQPDIDHLRMYNSSPIDKLGLFGAVGQDLSGKGFSLVYTIDTGEPWLVSPPSENGSNGTTVYVSGNNPYYQLGNAVTASLTINGTTISDIGKSSSNSAAPSGVGSQQQIAATTHVALGQDGFSISTYANTNTDGGYDFNNTLYPGRATFSVSTVFSNTHHPEVDLYSGSQGFVPFSMSMTSSEYDDWTLGHFDASALSQSFTLYFRRSYISLQENVAPVPEPGEWAMMAAGGLIAGAAARRRKR